MDYQPRLICLLLFLLLVAKYTVVRCSELQYLGCYDLTYALRKNMHIHMVGAELSNCNTLCQSKGNKEFGVERSDNFCYCGDDIADESLKRSDSLCNVPCPGETNRTCGGDWLMSLYKYADPTTTPSVVEVTASPNGAGDNVGFLLALSTGARLYRSSNMYKFDTIMTSTEWVYNVDYHYSKGWAYEYTGKRLVRSSLNGKSALTATIPKLIREMSGNCDGFTVDWAQDRIYFANCGSGSVVINSMDLEGRNMTEVFSRPGDFSIIKRMEIDPYKRKLFWIAAGIIESYELSSDNFYTNMSVPGVFVRALSLDLQSRRVFYIGVSNSSTALYSMDYQGQASTTHYATQQMRSVYGMGVYKDWVYWVNYANVRDVVYKGPKNRNGTLVIQMLSGIDKAVWHMKVVHPNLQKKPKVTSCLEGFVFLQDKEECIESTPTKEMQVREVESSMTVLLVSVFLIAVGILLSASLLYLGDRYWSTLRGMLIGVPYSREQGREDTADPQYHVDCTEDNMNLI